MRENLYIIILSRSFQAKKWVDFPSWAVSALGKQSPDNFTGRNLAPVMIYSLVKKFKKMPSDTLPTVVARSGETATFFSSSIRARKMESQPEQHKYANLTL